MKAKENLYKFNSNLHKIFGGGHIFYCVYHMKFTIYLIAMNNFYSGVKILSKKLKYF